MRRWLLTAATVLWFGGTAGAQRNPVDPAPAVPSVALSPADPIRLTGDVDSNSPILWEREDGAPVMIVLTSSGGRPSRASGANLDVLGDPESVEIEPWPGGGVWLEAVIPDTVGTWYGFYHNENTAAMCGEDYQKVYPRVGAARSLDQGATWTDLGIILEAPVETFVCDTNNTYFVGGVGDLSAVLDRDQHDVYIYFSQYGREKEDQGVGVARVPWADLDEPVGKVTVWNDGVWLPATLTEDDGGGLHWEYPHATPLTPTTKPFHTGGEVNAFWGPSIHWNHWLQQYVMLLNRSNGDAFEQEGIYASYNPRLDDPAAWSTPTKILDGGSWYPQVVGGEIATGTDTYAGRVARFFMSGRSDFLIEFLPPGGGSDALRKK